MTDLSNRSPQEIQSEIAATRHSLDRKLDALQHRLDPRERIEHVKARASDVVESARERAGEMLDGARSTLAGTREKLHPRNLEPYAGWMAVGAVVAGTAMAINGWRRLQDDSMVDATDVGVGTDVTVVNTSDRSDLPPAP